jgi:predicted NAD/FAD-dependent oxidoreductase
MAGTRVTVAGGGIAGMTVALRLAQRGCDVTLYEVKNVLGGNLASGLPDEQPQLPTLATERKLEFDVYPHMYQAWYGNFWKLLNDSGVKVDFKNEKPEFVQGFTPFCSFYQLRKKRRLRQRYEQDHATLTKLTYPYSTGYLLENLASDVIDPVNMFAAGYASIDLQAERMRPTVRLRNMSLTGYLNSRTYLSQAAIDAYETFIARVWGVPAYLVSAADYRTYAAYCYGAAEEASWLSCGPAGETIIDPIERAFSAATGTVTVVRETRVAEITCQPGQPGRVTAIHLEETAFSPELGEWVKKAGSTLREEPVETLVLALPPKPLARVARAGEPGTRLVDALPRLHELARVQTERMPMLHLPFERKLDDPRIPREPVALYGSMLSLSYTDISKTREDQPFKDTFSDRTVLAVSCSEPFMLPGDTDDNSEAIIKELKQYLPFKKSDLDAVNVHYRDNADVQLSLNEIGTNTWRPQTRPDEVENLFFAGDFCENDFGITTVEAAVATGLAAANAVLTASGKDPFPVTIPATLPDADFLTMRYAWRAAAYAAHALSAVRDHAGGKPGPAEGKEAAPTRSGGAPSGSEPGRGLLRYLLTPGLPPRSRPSGGSDPE